MAKNIKIKPLGDNIVVKPLEEESTTKSGIVIPDTVSKESPQKGEVVALGTGKVLKNGKTVDFIVKIGDKVLFKKYSPTEIKLDNEDYLIMSQEDILGIIE